MKIVKRILFFILAVISLFCAAILVFAFNPSLTDALAEKLNGSAVSRTQESAGEETQDGQPGGETTGNTENTGNIDTIYVTPVVGEVTSPEAVRGRNGYEPVRENVEQIADEDAETLQGELDTGETGEDITFDARFYPYYAMLSEEKQALYRQIYANAVKLADSFAPVTDVTVDGVKEVFEAVYNDHPELFWLETGYSCKYLRSGKCLELTLQYNMEKERIPQAKESFQQAARELTEGAEGLPNDAEKEKYVHDALVDRVEYEESAAMNQSAYSALVNGRTVCAGYARAFQYVMTELGIPCYYCTGYSGEDHAWNIVETDNGYYNVDVTWDDTDPSTYDYYNKTDAQYARTHIRKGMSVRLPACNGNGEGAADSQGGESGGEQNGGSGQGNGGSTLSGAAQSGAGEQGSMESVSGQDGGSGNGQDGDSGQGSAGTDPSQTVLINPDPQEPLEWLGGYRKDTQDNEAQKETKDSLELAGLTEEEVSGDMTAYYADCLEQMTAAGMGQQQFINVVPESLWSSVERSYTDNSYLKGYAEEAMKKLGAENFAIQLQAQRLDGGYYRLYHNILTW